MLRTLPSGLSILLRSPGGGGGEAEGTTGGTEAQAGRKRPTGGGGEQPVRQEGDRREYRAAQTSIQVGSLRALPGNTKTKADMGSAEVEGEGAVPGLRLAL